ncbi:hypothetical protein GGX14DRAFT_532634 [Mycena pura]|uniref:Uncharacterized protein n=1 Tax=Mycena pura TaxID=153505 RepID=A0AAD6VRQ1_9AGAR|nr:hypothetical protein GGX14DRAFT_532634 [Mycena pura]
MTQTYEVCMRDLREVLHHQLSTRDFKDNVNMVPYQQFNHQAKRVWSNLMSGEWAWTQATRLITAPVVGGSDKTTVSVATGHQEYHPVYASPGILTGPTRRAHGKGVLPVAFLAIPKSSYFCRQMYHASLALVVRCPDGHFRRVIYGIGPYIADYPEQVWLAAVVQNWCPKCDAFPDNLDTDGTHLRTRTKTEALIMCFDPGILWDDYGIRADIAPFTNDFPRADIHELLSPDLLHQVIKGTFKDHIGSWVNEYLHLTHGEQRALVILTAAVPEFPGLRRFPDFHHWTGDDSKALMKIYLAAVAGYLPSDMVKAISTFMDFCYLHSLVHYPCGIRLFWSPNGLCSSITESKHIKAVKEPWRCSSRYCALSQMLRTLVRLDKLAALRSEFTVRGMMRGTTSSYTARVLAGEQPQIEAIEAAEAVATFEDDENDDDGVVYGPRSLSDLELAPTKQHGYPRSLPILLRRFLHEELHGLPNAQWRRPSCSRRRAPHFRGEIRVHHSAIARFYAPSDLGEAGGMYREHIRSNPKWHGYTWRDTVLVNTGRLTIEITRGLSQG